MTSDAGDLAAVRLGDRRSNGGVDLREIDDDLAVVDRLNGAERNREITAIFHVDDDLREPTGGNGSHGTELVTAFGRECLKSFFDERELRHGITSYPPVPPAATHDIFSFCLLVAACGNGRDVVPESRDVHTPVDVPSTTKPQTSDAYEYVARRPLGTVALAEGRGLSPELSSGAIDRLADMLQSCAGELQRQGKLVSGAVRVIAQIGPDGLVTGVNVKVAPGATANALLCVIAPVKLLTFPPSSADAGALRGMAIEAAW